MSDEWIEPVLHILLIVGIWVISLFFWAWIVMLIWNCLMPVVFDLPVISYWQSMGIYALCSILLKKTFNINTKK